MQDVLDRFFVAEVKQYGFIFPSNSGFPHHVQTQKLGYPEATALEQQKRLILDPVLGCVQSVDDLK